MCICLSQYQSYPTQQLLQSQAFFPFRRFYKFSGFVNSLLRILKCLFKKRTVRKKQETSTDLLKIQICIQMDQVQSSYFHCSYSHSSYPQSSYARSSYGSKFLRLTVPTDSMFLQLQSSYSSKILHFKVPMGAKFLQLQSSFWFKVHTVSMFLLVQSSYIQKFLQVKFLEIKYSYVAKFLLLQSC